MTKPSTDTKTNPQEPESFEEWADRVAREYNETEADRYACGGQNCAGAFPGSF